MIDNQIVRQFAFCIALYAWFAPLAVGQDSLSRDYNDQLQRIAPQDPQSALQQFEIAEGLKIELVACEPMICDPVAITFDEFGRAYVVEMRGYSERTDQLLGRIKILEDSDQDGQFDRATVFAEGFRWPTAVVCAFGGILVGDAPDIIYLRDLNDDGTADVRQILLTGFGTSNVQQLPNNFQWGIDNRIYGSSGGNGGRIVRTDVPQGTLPANIALVDQPPMDVRGRDFAINPADLSLIAISGGSQFGMTFDRFGTRFVCSNSNHCQQVILQENYAVRNQRQPISSSSVNIAADGPAAEVFRISPVEPWRKVRTRLRVQGLVTGPIEGGGRAAGYFTSATGITCYDGDQLPTVFAGNMFVGDVGSNLVHRKQLNGQGIQRVANRSESDTEFLRSPDNWFRPVQLANAPDGSLFVLDMYRETIEHPDSLPPIIKQHLDLNSGNNRGRLYRIVPDDHVSERRLLPGKATPQQLVQMLEHPNGWHRQTASRLLFEKPWPKHELVSIIKWIRGHANSALNSAIPETRIRSMYLLAKLDRIQSVELIALMRDPHPQVRIHALRLAEKQLDQELEKQILDMTTDKDVQVRFQIALTLGELDSESCHAIADLAVSDGNNSWMKTALANSAYRNRGSILERLIERVANHPEALKNCRPLILELASQVARLPDQVDLKSIARILKHWPAENELLLAALVAKFMKMPTTRLQKLNSELQKADLDFQFFKDRALTEARSVANNRANTLPHRVMAINVLSLDLPAVRTEFLERLLETVEPPAIKQAAISLASQSDSDEIGTILMNQADALNPELRSRIVQVLVSRNHWTEQLLASIETKKFSSVFVDAATRQRLMRHEKPALQAAAKKLFDRGTVTDLAQLTDHYLQQLTILEGDANRGKELFRKSCASCHRLDQYGTEIGPNLAAFANRGMAAMVTNILDPNREVDPRYLSYQVLLMDGRTLLGVISSESATTIVLQDSQGKTETILRDDIDEMKSSTLSLMPEKLEQDIDPQAMADLIQYLLNQGS